MSAPTELYLKSPIWAQHAMVAVWGWWWYRRRYGARFQRIAAGYRARERWTRAQFETYQDERLAHLFQAAWNSPYYRQLFDEAGCTRMTPPRQALEVVPCLTKQTVRTRERDLLTQSRRPRGTELFRSSGTTGTPTTIYSTPDAHVHQTAVRSTRLLEWAGATYRDRRVMFGSRKVCRFQQDRPPFWRFSPVEDLAYASIYHLSREFLPAYVAFLREFTPAVVQGYPSALDAVAQYALETGDYPAPARVVSTTAEAVPDELRERLERTWNCRVADHYGAVESCVFASQCEFGRYHVSPEIGLIEILDDDGRPCARGVPGEVVCTGLQNTLQPLIRYRIGDIARWSVTQSCACGREMPIVEDVDGRIEDMCWTLDGRQMLRFDTVFKGVQSIREAQVVQEALDRFVIRVVPAKGFGAPDVSKLTHNMRLHVGHCQVVVETVTAIPRTSSGKFRAVVCNLRPEEKKRLPCILQS